MALEDKKCPFDGEEVLQDSIFLTATLALLVAEEDDPKMIKITNAHLGSELRTEETIQAKMDYMEDKSVVVMCDSGYNNPDELKAVYLTCVGKPIE